MSLQFVKSTSDAARGAEARDPDVPVALVEDTQSVSLSESERDATGPPLTWTQIALGLLIHCWFAFHERRERQRLRTVLYHLSDRELMDIGVTSTEIECIAAHRALDRLRDGTDRMWMR